ncbi:MAG: dephospho-CoA kinase [SAR202 cluster bacterium]|nr:dephospho-CoA kinase [SAR202 cluster bacterium]|tara:strand:- start:21236 stop:21820 length:585 start_codon:yes stop_codon:yes gene_type:complete
MIKVGLTGGIGTGKSLVSEILQSLGAHVISGDALGHEAYLPGTKGFDQVVNAFGNEIVGDDGFVDRKKLGPIVFSDPSNLDILNSIMHPLIYEMIKERISIISDESIVVVEAAVLIEANWQDLFDEIWVVTSEEEIVIARLADRNNLSRNDAISRIKSQMPQDERITHAHVEIDNSGTKSELEQTVKDIWNNKL